MIAEKLDGASLDRVAALCRITEEQIIAILREQEAGAKTAEVCRRHGISSATFYAWKAKFGGMEPSGGDLPPGRPSVITRVLGVDSGRFRVGQARRARSPQIAQALGARRTGSCCPARNGA